MHEVAIIKPRWPVLRRLGFILLLWLVTVDAGAELWYRGLESHVTPSLEWSVVFPADNPTLKKVPISAETKNLLRFDEAEQGAWVGADGTRWQSFYCSWLPGRVAGTWQNGTHRRYVCLQQGRNYFRAQS